MMFVCRGNNGPNSPTDCCSHSQMVNLNSKPKAEIIKSELSNFNEIGSQCRKAPKPSACLPETIPECPLMTTSGRPMSQTTAPSHHTTTRPLHNHDHGHHSHHSNHRRDDQAKSAGVQTRDWMHSRMSLTIATLWLGKHNRMSRSIESRYWCSQSGRY